MKRFLLTLILITFVYFSMDANDYYYLNSGDYDCDYKQPEYCYALRAEFLYFKADFDQGEFANLYTTGPFNAEAKNNITRKNISLNFRPGVRLEGDWIYDCNNLLQLRYAFLYNGNKSTVTGWVQSAMFGGFEASSNTDPVFGTAVGRLSMRYQAAEIVWKNRLLNSTYLDLHFLSGIKGATIKFSENTKFRMPGAMAVLMPNIGLEDNWRSRFWGIGPEVGFTTSYCLPCLFSLSVVGDFRGALLVGRTTGTLKHFVIDTTGGTTLLTFKNKPDHWGGVVAFDGRIGFNSAVNWLCYPTNFEIGYEMIVYVNAVHKIWLEEGQRTSNLFSNYCAHGPYLALHSTF